MLQTAKRIFAAFNICWCNIAARMHAKHSYSVVCWRQFIDTILICLWSRLQLFVVMLIDFYPIQKEKFRICVCWLYHVCPSFHLVTWNYSRVAKLNSRHILISVQKGQKKPARCISTDTPYVRIFESASNIYRSEKYFQQIFLRLLKDTFHLFPIHRWPKLTTVYVADTL